jgi:hypothetical protein
MRKVTINGKNINDILETYQDKYVTIDISPHDGKIKHKIGGTVRVEKEFIDVPYNPLTDMDCGTDAMINKGEK